MHTKYTNKFICLTIIFPFLYHQPLLAKPPFFDHDKAIASIDRPLSTRGDTEAIIEDSSEQQNIGSLVWGISGKLYSFVLSLISPKTTSVGDGQIPAIEDKAPSKPLPCPYISFSAKEITTRNFSLRYKTASELDPADRMERPEYQVISPDHPESPLINRHYILSLAPSEAQTGMISPEYICFDCEHNLGKDETGHYSFSNPSGYIRLKMKEHLATDHTLTPQDKQLLRDIRDPSKNVPLSSFSAFINGSN